MATHMLCASSHSPRSRSISSKTYGGLPSEELEDMQPLYWSVDVVQFFKEMVDLQGTMREATRVAIAESDEGWSRVY